MNAQQLAQNAYAPAINNVRSDRSTEHSVFSKATYRLRQTMDALPNGYASHVMALHENQKLWTLLAVDVADQGNALNDDLRARIFYLAEFTQHHTRKVLKGEANAEALIEINTAIMRGLHPEGSPN